MLRALHGDPADLRGFGRPAEPAEVVAALTPLAEGGTAGADGDRVTVDLSGVDVWSAGRAAARLAAAAFALGWLPADEAGPAMRVSFTPATP